MKFTTIQKLVLTVLMCTFISTLVVSSQNSSLMTKKEWRDKRKLIKEQKKLRKLDRRSRKYQGLRDTLVITVNEKMKQLPSVAHYNDEILLKFENINTFLYDVSLNEVQKDWISKESTEKKHNMFYPVSDFNLNEVLLKNINDIAIDKTQIKQVTEAKVNEIKTKEIKLKFKQRKLKSLELQVLELNNYLDAKSIKADTLSELKIRLSLKYPSEDFGETFKALKSDHAILKDQIENLSDSIEILNLEKEILASQEDDTYLFKTFFIESVNEYRSAVDKLSDLKSYYSQLQFLLYSSKKFNTILKERDNLTKLFFGKECAIGEVVNGCNERIQDVKDKFMAVDKAYEKIDSDKEVSATYAKLKQFHINLNFNKQYDFVNEIQKLYEQINIKNWTVCFQTTDINPKADNIFYSMEATPRDNQFNTVTQPISKNYSLPIEGGIKIDISAGMLFNIGLKDDEYRFEAVTPDSTAIKKVRTSDKFMPYVGVLFNVYKRSTANIKLAGNFGAATNSEKINYYLGGSLIFGKSERIILSSGIVGGQVNRIDPEYSDKEGIAKPIGELPNEILYRKNDPFKIGFFVGVTYNLTGNNESEAKRIFTK